MDNLNLDLEVAQNSKAVMICQQNCKRIYELRSSGANVDILLCPLNSNSTPASPSYDNSVFIPAHRIFLRNCPYFEKRLELNCGDHVVKEVMEVGCDQETLEVVIKFLYIGEIELAGGDDDRFTKIFRASREFELPEMTKACLDFCSRNINMITQDNWLEMYRYILSIMEISYLVCIFGYLHNNINDIIGSNSFLVMTFDELKIILENASDIFNTQEEFLLATYNWLSYEESEVKRSLFTTELAKFTWHDKKVVLANTPSKNKKRKSAHIFESPSTSTSQSPAQSPLQPQWCLGLKEESQSSDSSTSSSLKRSRKSNVSGTLITQPELPQLSIKMENNDNDHNLSSTSTSLRNSVTLPIKRAYNKNKSKTQSNVKTGRRKMSNVKENKAMDIVKTEYSIDLNTQRINEEFPDNFNIIFRVENLNELEPNTFTLYCYSPKRQLVSKLADLPRNNLQKFSMVATNDKLYILGGLIKTTAEDFDLVRDVQSFDLSLKGCENSSLFWTNENEMLLKDAMSLFPTLTDGKNSIYVIGGFFQDRYITNYIDKLDLNEKSRGWQEVGSMNYGRERCSAAIINNKIYASGGNGNKDCSKTARILKTFEVFDINSSTGQGQNLKQMREERLDHNLVAYKNDLYALGGYTKKDRKTNTVEVYDSILNIWESAPSMNYIRADSASFVFNNSLYVIGGEEEDVIMEKYDHENKTWIKVQTPSDQFPENSDFSSSIVLMLPSNESSN